MVVTQRAALNPENVSEIWNFKCWARNWVIWWNCHFFSRSDFYSTNCKITKKMFGMRKILNKLDKWLKNRFIFFEDYNLVQPGKILYYSISECFHFGIHSNRNRILEKGDLDNKSNKNIFQKISLVLLVGFFVDLICFNIFKF